MFKNKYLKYKNKYLALKGGASSDDAINDTIKSAINDAITNIEHITAEKRIKYEINFLWLNRNVSDARHTQKYIFPISKIYDINFPNTNNFAARHFIINLEQIMRLIHIIEWNKLHPTIHINIWHDCSDEMAENTIKLINDLNNNE